MEGIGVAGDVSQPLLARLPGAERRLLEPTHDVAHLDQVDGHVGQGLRTDLAKRPQDIRLC